MKNNSDLFFTCSLIEYIGRECKLERNQVVEHLGSNMLNRIYKYADVLHCEPIAKTADVYIEMCKMPLGEYDNVQRCKYEVPDYWSIGEVYERLIEDVICANEEEDVIKTLESVYTSWINKVISNYNSDFFYQSRDYIYESFKAGEVL